nr:unnamed protein product [Callosobruchus analis]
MPGCAAVNCSNSAKKGFIMKRFPRDPVRRKEWLIKMKRGKWIPTDYSCLCEDSEDDYDDLQQPLPGPPQEMCL